MTSDFPAGNITYPSAFSSVKWENITGTIKDNQGEPLPGVSVKIKGTNTGTVTDINGTFRLNLPTGNETLVVSYLGFSTQEIAVGGRTQLNIVLTESTSSLDEVVVTGYGTKKRSELVGSVATISGSALEDIPAPNIAGALRGRIAGLSVNQVSGRPGSSITLNVRNSSVSDQGAAIGATAEPLYIIDGITVSSNEFNNLDASMVETITVLKDASAAIYGAAGAKGVVLVTTKKGKQGKPSISYNGYVGVSDAAQTPDMLSAYELANLLNDGYKSQGTATASSFFSQEDLDYIKNLNFKSWYDEVWSSSLTQKHNLSVSGGSDKITFFVGGSYQNENGNYIGLKQDRYGFRSGLTAKVVEGLTAELNFSVDHRIRESKSSVSENDANFFESIITTPQWVPISINGMYVNTSLRNPLAILESGYYQNSKSKSYRVNAALSYQPSFLKGLTARFQISQTAGNSKGRQYAPPYKLYNFRRTGNNNALYMDSLARGLNTPDGIDPIYQAVSPASASLTPSISENSSYQGFITLNYSKKIGIHSLDLTVGGEQTVGNDENIEIQLTNQLIPGFSDQWAFDRNTLVLRSNTINESTKRSFFGRLSYDWDKKYLIEGVARLDASSNFATGNRWGLSPSVGLGWVVSKEDFFKDNVSFVNFLKLKMNYGIAGDDRVTARLWQQRFLLDGAGNGYLFGNNDALGINPSTFPNLDITWEKKRTFNLGVEASLFNDKVDVSAEFFQNKTFDGFDKGAERLYPFYAGFRAPVVNYRQAYVWGSEFSLGYKAKIGREVNMNASMNFSYGNSVVDQMIYPISDAIETNLNDGKYLGNKFGTDPRKYNSSNVGLISKGMFRTQEQVDAFLAENPNYKLYGVTPQPGWLYYEDANGDGTINDYDMVYLYDNINPFFSTSITLGASYKAFSLNANIAARFGGKVFYDSRARTKPSTTTNVLSFWADHWSSDNTGGKFPRFDDPTINKNSDFWAVDGTTIRINNMSLAYKIPAKFAQKAGLQSARVLLTGNNLWTIVNPLPYKDPYTSSAYDYPTLRTISLGLSVNL
ncbi:SusC/RagA family TonB-linked outer membrane protein [Pelobium manganitolerans]|uniref:SusC/RagA family TonB-linked outer membrane protein n=1 Tax=Pelobium manganitolerans TaxID=1842495 RepID=A0A419SB18_9SPHI|nr:SusC/RagA family TonB-linked outer membrane protein [Pelobium manganitolerans]